MTVWKLSLTVFTVVLLGLVAALAEWLNEVT